MERDCHGLLLTDYFIAESQLAIEQIICGRTLLLEKTSKWLDGGVRPYRRRDLIQSCRVAKLLVVIPGIIKSPGIEVLSEHTWVSLLLTRGDWELVRIWLTLYRCWRELCAQEQWFPGWAGTRGAGAVGVCRFGTWEVVISEKSWRAAERCLDRW